VRKRDNGRWGLTGGFMEGFIATAYRAEAIKEGELLWHP